MLKDVFNWAEEFIFNGAQFVNWLNENLGFGNFSVLQFFTFAGLTFFIGMAITTWIASFI